MYKVQLNDGSVFNFSKEGNEFLNEKGDSLDLLNISSSAFHVIKEGKSTKVLVDKIDQDSKEVHLRVNNKEVVAKISDKMDLLLKSMGLENALVKKMNEQKAPMPGLVLEVSAKVGSQVQKGDALLILEAMKMENVIKAAGDGVVKEIKVKPQQAVEKNEVLITFE